MLHLGCFLLIHIDRHPPPPQGATPGKIFEIGIVRDVPSVVAYLAEPDKLAFMVALGYPAHTAKVVPMTEETGIKYYLDEDRNYCVPKRSREELARSL